MSLVATDANFLSASDAVNALAHKKISVVELMQACLARIDKRDAEVGAWAYLDRDSILREAKDRDGKPQGPLYGLPVGIKDVIDTAGLPTEYGSKIYRGHRPARDASCVALVRRAGGIVFGKTVTTEFALFQPGKTKNPHNPAHSPGGSSSGSAAAVADFQVPVAFGTQTSGSTIRPAAFCGVVGYKPTFSLFTAAGVRALAPSLDTLGLMSRTVEDLFLMTRVLFGHDQILSKSPGRRIRLALCRTPFWAAASVDQQAAFDNCARELAAAGVSIEEIDLPDWFSSLGEDHQSIMASEIARNFISENSPSTQELLSPRMREIIDEGWKVHIESYLKIRARVSRARIEFSTIAKPFDAIMVPSAPGEAPKLANTGDPVFNRVWTLLGIPAVTLPVGFGTHGLPLGVQCLGRADEDHDLLATCRELEKMLGARCAVPH